MLWELNKRCVMSRVRLSTDFPVFVDGPYKQYLNVHTFNKLQYTKDNEYTTVITNSDIPKRCL